MTKLKLGYLKFGFKYKKESYKHRQFFCITRVRHFSSSAQVCFKNTAVGLPLTNGRVNYYTVKNIYGVSLLSQSLYPQEMVR